MTSHALSLILTELEGGWLKEGATFLTHSHLASLRSKQNGEVPKLSEDEAHEASFTNGLFTLRLLPLIVLLNLNRLPCIFAAQMEAENKGLCRVFPLKAERPMVQSLAF